MSSFKKNAVTVYATVNRPLVGSFVVGVWSVLTLLGLPARLAAAEPDPDEGVLRRAGVSSDDRGLLAFFHDRAGTDDDLTRLDSLVRQLGSRSFKARNEAVEKLVRLGPAADEVLSAALLSKDLEVAVRAKTVLQQIQDRKLWDRHDPVVVLAALRLLMQKKPEGAAEALLRYLPYAAHRPLADELWVGLDALAAARPKAEPAVVKALDDPVAARRAAAAYLAARRGDPSQQAAARKLLADTDPLVRLRAAQGLLGRGRKEALPVLIDLLQETPLELAWQAEELLHWAAGDQAPEAVVGAGGKARGRCRAAWRAWWRTRGDALDLSRAAGGGRRPGLVLASWGNPDGGKAGVWLLGCSRRPRLEVKIQSLVRDVQLMPEGRFLLNEFPLRSSAGSVTIRDAEGEILWRYGGAKGPAACYPLARGRLLVAERRVVTEVTPAGQLAWSCNFSRLRGVPGLEYPQRLPSGNFVGISRPSPGRVDLVETGPEGASVVKQVTLRDAVTLVGRVRIEVSAGRTYLLANTSDGLVREVDGSGKTVWKSRPLAARDVARLNDGTLMVAAGRRVVELTRSGGVAWEVLLPAGAGAVRPCLRLVRLGFDAPQAADLDLDASVEYRLAGLRSRDPLVRQWSARVLPRMGTKAEEVVPALIQALDDPDPETRDAARGALEQVVGPKTVPLLLKAARGKSIRVRVAVALVCGQLAGQGKAVTPTLVKMLEDHDEAVDGDTTLRGLKVCHAAAIALGNHGPAAGEAVPALTAALKSDDALLRRLATFSLGRIELKGRRLPMVRPHLEPREDRFCPAKSTTWQAMADGAWNVAANWDNGVPGPADAAIFDPAKSNKNVIRSDTIAATVAKLTINLNYTGTIRLKSLTVGHDLGRCTSTLQNGIISVADIGFVKIHSGTFNWSAGTIESRFRPAPPPGPGKPSHPPTFFVDPGATANLTGSANFAGNFDLLNEGTMIVSTSNNITVGNGSTVTNSGTLDVQSDIGFVGMPLRGQGGFDNSGSFKKSAGTGQTRLYMPFTNSGGDLEVRAGMVYLVASGKQTNGKTTIYAGATLGSPTTYEVSEGILQGQGVGTSTVIGNLTLAGGDFYVGTNGTIATFRVTNNYIQTGGTLHIDVDGKQRQQSDLLIAENTAMLGGNLTVHTLNGRKPANAVAILKHGGRQNDFASKTYLGGVTYTPDLSQMFKEYALKP